MRIITQGKRRRKVYAFQEGDEFMLSPLEQAINGYRPIARYGSKEELLATTRDRKCEVIWQAN